MKSIVLCLDGSRRAEQSVPMALALMGPATEAEVVLIRVVEPPIYAGAMPIEQALEVSGDEALKAERYLEETAARMRERGWQVRTVLAEGPAADAILKAAQHERADFLVMGSRGRNGLVRWLLGSVTERVARQAVCPVLVVRTESEEEPLRLEPAVLRDILVPLDGSVLDQVALGQVRLLPSGPKRLVLLSATDHPLASPAEVLGWPTSDEVLDDLEADLEQTATELREQGMTVTCRVEDSPAADAVLTASEAENPDLILMATHGRQGLERWWLGSVAEKVLRQARCPVMLVRARSTETERSPASPDRSG